MFTIEFITGKWGGQNARYVFHVNRRKDDRTYWRCNKCPARLITEAGSYVSSTPHNNDPQPADVQIQRAKVSTKKMASTTELPTKRIMATGVSGLSFESMARLNAAPESLGRMIRRARQKAFAHPINPSSLEDLIIPPKYITTHSGDSFMLWDPGYTPTPISFVRSITCPI